MSDSELVYTSSEQRSADVRAWRPSIKPNPRQPPPARPPAPVGAGRLCPFCRAPFKDLNDFGRHVWDEAEPYIRARRQQAAASRRGSQRTMTRYYSDPEVRARMNETARQFRLANPDYLREYQKKNRDRINARRRARAAEQRNVGA